MPTVLTFEPRGPRFRAVARVAPDAAVCSAVEQFGPGASVGPLLDSQVDVPGWPDLRAVITCIADRPLVLQLLQVIDPINRAVCFGGAVLNGETSVIPTSMVRLSLHLQHPNPFHILRTSSPDICAKSIREPSSASRWAVVVNMFLNPFMPPSFQRPLAA